MEWEWQAGGRNKFTCDKVAGTTLVSDEVTFTERSSDKLADVTRSDEQNSYKY